MKLCIEAKVSLVLAFLAMVLGIWIGLARAEVDIIDELKKIPEIHQSVLFSLDDSSFDYASSITIASLFDKKVNLDIGWTPKQKLIGLASFKLVSVGKYLDYPILRWIEIEPYIYLGWDRLALIKTGGNNEFDKGFGVKLISIKL